MLEYEDEQEVLATYTRTSDFVDRSTEVIEKEERRKKKREEEEPNEAIRPDELGTSTSGEELRSYGDQDVFLSSHHEKTSFNAIFTSGKAPYIWGILQEETQLQLLEQLEQNRIAYLLKEHDGERDLHRFALNDEGKIDYEMANNVRDPERYREFTEEMAELGLDPVQEDSHNQGKEFAQDLLQTSPSEGRPSNIGNSFN